jgi:hypothetical protein
MPVERAPADHGGLTIEVVLTEKGRESAVTYQTIRQAIMDRQCASALYEDYVRVFCPRTIGKDKSGTAVVAAFQYGGGCPGGLPRGGKWCCFRVSDIDLISITGDAWRTGTSGRRISWVTDVDVAS